MLPVNFSPPSAEGGQEFAGCVKMSGAEDLPILLSDFVWWWRWHLSEWRTWNARLGGLQEFSEVKADRQKVWAVRSDPSKQNHHGGVVRNRPFQHRAFLRDGKIKIPVYITTEVSPRMMHVVVLTAWKRNEELVGKTFGEMHRLIIRKYLRSRLI